MKSRKIGAAFSALTAAACFTATASAYLEVPSETTSFLTATADNWRLSISSSYGVDYTRLDTIRAVVEVTDAQAYETDKENGLYSDGETAFADFTGAMSFGGAEWLQFNVESLSDCDAGDETAEVRALSDGTYLITAYLPEGTEPSPLLSSISLAEWGNRSSDYSLRIRSFGLYAEDLEPIVVFDASGEQIDPPELLIPDDSYGGSAADPEFTEGEPEETESAETAAEDAPAANEPEETEPAETTTAAELTETTSEEAAENASAEAVQTQSAPPAQAIGSAGFAARDSGLTIVMIAAGVLIVAAAVGIVMVSLKKRK